MKALNYLLDSLKHQVILGDASGVIHTIQFDSRETNKDSLFIAIEGFSQNGHDYLEAAYKKMDVGILLLIVRLIFNPKTSPLDSSSQLE